MRILLVEDEDGVAAVLRAMLTEQNHVVDTAEDGELGWDLVELIPYDLVILDVMLPKLDGIRFCQRLREKKNPVLVLMLTARDTITDKLIGLNAGADDYVIKPFNPEELAARVKALARRCHSPIAMVVRCGNLQLDATAREVTYGGQVLQFSRKEFLLLELLMRNPHRVFSRAAIVDQLWSHSEDAPDEDTIKSHIKTVRRKLSAVGAGDLIETLYGQGYRINPAFCNVGSSAIAPSPDPAPTLHQQMDSTVAAIWQRTQGVSLERVAFLESIVQALDHGRLDEATYRQAIQTAHKLVGSLGTFGFDEGTQCARHIERLLHDSSVQLEGSLPQGKTAQRKLARQLQPLMLALCQTLAIQPSGYLAAIESPAQSATSVLVEPVLPEATVLAVDDDAQILWMLKALLKPHDIELVGLAHTNQFWDVLRSVQPDLLILDVSMPAVSGLDLCEWVRNHYQWNWLPVVVLSAQSDRLLSQQAFARGADDFVPKSALQEELVPRVLNRLARSQKLRRQSSTDSLTGVATRPAATQAFEQLLNLSKRSQQPICLAVLELPPVDPSVTTDQLDWVDAQLHQFGQLLKATFRASDIVSRWNDREFIVGLYGAFREEGVERIAEVLEVWRSHAPLDPNVVPLPYYFTAGVSQYPVDGTQMQMLYRTAEAALYRAKELGHDRVLSAAWQPLSSQPIPTVDVFLVCPEGTLLRALLRSLQTRGYHTHWVETGKAALEVLKGTVPRFKARSLLIAEHLTGGSGFAVFQQLGKRFLRQTRAIALLESPDLTEQVQALGVFDYLLLPCDPPQIVQRLHRALKF